MKICGIVGWKNSGKTFLVRKLITHFKTLNLKVASIKHAHHNFDIDKPGTDSFYHREAGSEQIIISSSKRWAKIVELEKTKEKKLFELIKEFKKPDIVIVEGFKYEKHPKIEIISEKIEYSNYLFPNLENVIGIVTEKKINTSIIQFKINQIDIIAQHILKNT